MTPATRCGSGDTRLLAAIHARSVGLPALRTFGAGAGDPEGGGGPCVVRVDPADGEAAVFGDAPVVITVSHPVDHGTLGPRTVRVSAGAGPLDGRLALSPDGRVVIWTPERPLAPGEHVLEVSGLRDRRGRDVRPHRSAFIVAITTFGDLLEDPAG